MSRRSSAAEAADDVETTIEAFSRGSPVLVHDFDDREDETDIVIPAAGVEPPDVAQLRQDAGGLVCVALPFDVAEAFDLPYLSEVLDHPATTAGPMAYGDRSSFSLPVNHRETYTGITDNDRARTISALARAARTPGDVDFAAEFRVPGHVNLLKAAPGLLSERRGHTELGIALAEAAGCDPAVVVCEMLDGTTGEARSRADARAYADEHGYPFLEGSAVVDHLG